MWPQRLVVEQPHWRWVTSWPLPCLDGPTLSYGHGILWLHQGFCELGERKVWEFRGGKLWERSLGAVRRIGRFGGLGSFRISLGWRTNWMPENGTNLSLGDSLHCGTLHLGLLLAGHLFDHCDLYGDYLGGEKIHEDYRLYGISPTTRPGGHTGIGWCGIFWAGDGVSTGNKWASPFQICIRNRQVGGPQKGSWCSGLQGRVRDTDHSFKWPLCWDRSRHFAGHTYLGERALGIWQGTLVSQFLLQWRWSALQGLWACSAIQSRALSIAVSRCRCKGRWTNPMDMGVERIAEGWTQDRWLWFRVWNRGQGLRCFQGSLE